MRSTDEYGRLISVKEQLEKKLVYHTEEATKIKSALTALETPGLADLVDLIRSNG